MFFLSPPPKGGGHTAFCADPNVSQRQHWRDNFLSAKYLMNEWMDLKHISMAITLGQDEDLIRFWWPWPNFQGNRAQNSQIIGQKCTLVCTLSLELMDGFGDLDSIFKVTTWPNFFKNKFLHSISWTLDGFGSKFIHKISGMVFRTIYILVPLTNLQGQRAQNIVKL